MPVMTKAVKGSAGAVNAFASYSLVSCDYGNIQIDTVKQSEDGKALIIRVYEYRNKKGQGSLTVNAPVSSAFECNLCEEEDVPVSVENGRISFAIGCFEVKTFKLYIG